MAWWLYIYNARPWSTLKDWRFLKYFSCCSSLGVLREFSWRILLEFSRMILPANIQVFLQESLKYLPSRTTQNYIYSSSSDSSAFTSKIPSEMFSWSPSKRPPMIRTGNTQIFFFCTLSGIPPTIISDFFFENSYMDCIKNVGKSSSLL